MLIKCVILGLLFTDENDNLDRSLLKELESDGRQSSGTSPRRRGLRGHGRTESEEDGGDGIIRGYAGS